MIASNRILINIIATFTKSIAANLFGFISGVILARYLGPGHYGQYSFSVSFCYLFMIISDFGLNDLYIKDIAANKGLAPKYIGASFFIKPSIGVISICFLYLILNILNYSNEIILYTMIFSIHIFFINQINTISSVFRSYERMEYSAYISLIIGVFSLFFVSILSYLNQSLTTIIIFRVIVFILVFWIGMYFLRCISISPNFNINKKFIFEVIKKSFPFLTSGLIHTLYIKIDLIMLSKMKGDVYVGYFTPAANDLFFGLFIIPSTIATVLYPIFSRQYVSSVDKMRESINFSIKILAVLGAPISVGTFILSRQITYTIFGLQYDNSISVLQIIALAILFVFIREPLGYGLASIGKVRILMLANIISLIINIFINFIVIPIYAHVGAALTSVICIFVSFFILFNTLNFYVKNLYLMRTILKPILASLLMGIVVFYCKNCHLIISILIGIIIYLPLIAIFKIFTKEEISKLRLIFSIK